MKRKWALHFEINFRIGHGMEWFKFEGTWKEQRLYRHQMADIWARLFLVICGFSFGAGIWVGKPAKV